MYLKVEVETKWFIFSILFVQQIVYLALSYINVKKNIINISQCDKKNKLFSTQV